jgi:hypothetical protein
MTNYVLVYKGGKPTTEDEGETVMAAWGAWIGVLGDSLVDLGNPFGPSSAVAADGSVSDGASSELTGYSVIKADSLSAAAEAAKGCPVLGRGGNVEVYETFKVM